MFGMIKLPSPQDLAEGTFLLNLIVSLPLFKGESEGVKIYKSIKACNFSP